MSATPPAFTAHLPRFVLEALAKETPQHLAGKVSMRRAAAMFCDISGFTPLSETLGRQGKAGTEELTIQLNQYFETLMGVVEDWGGDTVKFGGDAITVLFEAQEGGSLSVPVSRAAAAAHHIFETLGVVRIAKTPWGEFPLSLKIGVSSGTLLTGLIGDWNDRMETVVAGEALDRMADAEHHAKPGDIVVDLGAEGVRESDLETSPAGEGFGKLLKCPSRVEAGLRPTVFTPPKGHAQPFLLPAVWGQLEAGSEGMLGEHRQIVTVFVAFPGLDYMDPESLAKLDIYFRRVQSLMRGFGGSFNRMDMGDKGSKFLGFFGAPESYEDNAERAIAFALALQDVEKELAWAKGQRIGLSLGTNFCGVMGSSLRREYTVMGDAVNIAARLMGAAKPGEALALRELREKARHRFRWGRYRALTLKGKSEPIQVSPPLGAVKQKTVQGAVSSVALVGREAELKVLRAARTRAGKGPVSFIVIQGEAGIGKTALLQAALAEARDQGWRTVMGTCQSLGASPMQVWVDAFRELLGEGEHSREVFEARLSLLVPEQAEFLSLALRFLGFSVALSKSVESLEPKERIEKTADLLARVLTALAKDKPLLLGLDGLSYADEATKDLLGGIRGHLHGGRVVLLGASREDAPLPGSPKRIELEGLSGQDARSLATGLLGASRITDALAQFLMERTHGNPLFLSELLQNLKECGAVLIDREGRVQFHTDRVGDTPGSIEGLLLARIDRLPLVTRNVLKVAACLGNSFELSFLQSVFQPRMEAEQLMGHLRSVEELGLTASPQENRVVFAFSHTALRDAAYNSVLLANRRSIHKSAAGWLESRGYGEDAALIAHHYGQAEIWEKALEFGIKAGFVAAEGYAFKEAASLFEGVLMWSEKSGRSISAAERITMANIFLQAGQPHFCRGLLDSLQMEHLSGEDRLRVGEAYLRLLESKDQHARCIEMAKGIINEAALFGQNTPLLRVYRAMISSLFRLGKLEEALAEIEKVRANPESEGETSASYDILEGAILLQRGAMLDAAKRYESALLWARSFQHLPLQLRATIGMANALRGSQDLTGALVYAQEAMMLAQRVGSRFNQLGASVTCSNILNLLGKHQEAGNLLEETLPLALQNEFPYASCNHLNDMGVTRYYQGRFREAIRFYRASLKIAMQIGNIQLLAHAEYNIADALKALMAIKSAERQYRKAIRKFRESQNPPWFVIASREALSMLSEAGDVNRRAALINYIKRETIAWNQPKLLEEALSST